MTTDAETLEEIRRLLGAERVEGIADAVAVLKARLAALEQAVDPAALRRRLETLEAALGRQRAEVQAALADGLAEAAAAARRTATEAAQASEARETAARERGDRLARDLAGRQERLEAAVEAVREDAVQGQAALRSDVEQARAALERDAARRLEEVACSLRASWDEALAALGRREELRRTEADALERRRHEDLTEQAARVAVLAARLETQAAGLEQRLAERVGVLYERTEATAAEALRVSHRLEGLVQALAAVQGLQARFDERLAKGLAGATAKARADLATVIEQRLAPIEAHRRADARRLAADTLIAVQRVEALAEDLRREREGPGA